MKPILLPKSDFEPVVPGVYQAGSLTMYDTEGFESRRDVSWLIGGVLPSVSLAVIYGRTGVMKTFLALDIALSVATGRDFVNMPVEQGRVVYFYLETPQTGRERVKAWRVDRGFEHIREISFVEHKPSMLSYHDNQKLISDLKLIKPALVVFDTVSALVAGEADENSTADMQRLFQRFREIRDAVQTTVLVVHHEGPSGLPRGSTVFTNDSDTVLRVQKRGKDDLAGKAYCKKQRGGAPGFQRLDFIGRLIDVGDSFAPWPGWAGTRSAPVLDYLNKLEPKLTLDDDDEQEQPEETLTERQQDALAYITKHPGCGVDDLATKLGVSNQTARKDAAKLEEERLIDIRSVATATKPRDGYYPVEK